MRDLEATLGIDLIARTSDGLEATPPAIVLARATRQARAELERGLEGARHGSGRVLVVGAMPLVRAGLLPSAIARLCADDSRVRFSVVEGSYADLLLGALREPAPDGVVQHRLFDDGLVIVARSGHRLARTTGWSASALTEYPWAASPLGTPRRDRWEDLISTDGNAKVVPRVECSSASAIRGLLLRGDWLAMLSPDQFKVERELGLLVALTGSLPTVSRLIGITVRKGWIADATQAAFLDVLQCCAAERDEYRETIDGSP